MNLSISMQSLKNIVRFPLQDPKWQNKLLIGSLLGLANFVIPIVPGLPLMGYLARVLRGGMRNDDASRLPEWDDWGDLFMDGLRVFGVTFITMLPSFVVMFIGWSVYMAGTFSMSSNRYSYGNGEAMLPFFASFVFFFLAMAVGMALSLAALIVMPPAVAHVVVKRRFSAFFEVSQWWGILRANFLGFVVALGAFFAVYMVVMFVTQILYMTIIFCCLIPFVLLPLGFYCGIILYRLIGQAYGEVAPADAAIGTAPAPAPAPVNTVVLPESEPKEPSSGNETVDLPESSDPEK